MRRLVVWQYGPVVANRAGEISADQRAEVLADPTAPEQPLCRYAFHLLLALAALAQPGLTFSPMPPVKTEGLALVLSLRRCSSIDHPKRTRFRVAL